MRILGASSTGVNARMGVSTPLSRTVKSEAVRPRTGSSFVVEDGNVELDQLDTGAKLRRLAWPLIAPALGQNHSRRDQHERRAHGAHTHGYSSRNGNGTRAP